MNETTPTMESITKIQDKLEADVHAKFWYYVEVKWANDMGSIHIHTRLRNMFETIDKLSVNYTRYWEREYKPDSITIKDIQNRNPHIKLDTTLANPSNWVYGMSD